MSQELVYAIVRTIHDLFTAIWIGGMFALLFAVIPSIIKVFGKSKESKKLLKTIKNRLSLIVYIGFIALFITGMLMANQSGMVAGLFNISTTYGVILTTKHIIYFIMIIIAILRSRIVEKLKIKSETKEKLNMILLVINVILAIVVVFLSGELSALVKFK
ncbi:MAG: CopD family protein [Candidatus Helarchaeota archaeon]